MPPIQLDDDCLRRVLPTATDLAASDVEVVGQIAFLTAEIDFNEDPEENWLLGALNRSLWRMIGEPAKPIAVVSPLPIDREERLKWIRELVPRLTTTHARELAYATAYLVVVIDLELAPVESALLLELQHALGINNDRAEEIAEVTSRMLTPLDVEPFQEAR
jgi:hypothetical protein